VLQAASKCKQLHPAKFLASTLLLATQRPTPPRSAQPPYSFHQYIRSSHTGVQPILSAADRTTNQTHRHTRDPVTALPFLAPPTHQPRVWRFVSNNSRQISTATPDDDYTTNDPANYLADLPRTLCKMKCTLYRPQPQYLLKSIGRVTLVSAVFGW